MGATQSTEFTSELQQLHEKYKKEGNAAIILYRYDDKSKEWHLHHNQVTPDFYDANEDRSEDHGREWHLEVPQADIDMELTSAVQFSGTNATCSVVFYDPGQDAVYQLLFGGVGSTERYTQFLQGMNDKLFENTYHKEANEKNAKAALGEYAEYLLDGGGDALAQADWEQVDPEPVPTGAEEKRSAEYGGEVIRALCLGAGTRSYLVRGPNIRVLRNVEGGVEDAGVDIRAGNVAPQTNPSQGTQEAPSARLLLHNQERMLNMLRPDERYKLSTTDLEAERVVSEWRFAKDGVDIPMADIASDSKGAQLGSGSTFLGLDVNRVCRWDMRTEEGAVQDVSPVLEYAGGKDYSRGTNFRCMATTGDGCVVIGSRDGKVRLYNPTSLQRAVTAVSSLGAPITAVDVTYDGHYVLATTDSYLMVIPTKTINQRTGEASIGFRHNMGKDKLPPKLLRLDPADVQFTKGHCLRQARFTWVTDAGRTERWICASVGNFTALWNFRQVKIAKPSSTSMGNLLTLADPSMYYLLPKQEDIVDSQFLHDNYATGGRTRDNVLVATTHNVWTVAPQDNAS